MNYNEIYKTLNKTTNILAVAGIVGMVSMIIGGVLAFTDGTITGFVVSGPFYFTCSAVVVGLATKASAVVLKKSANKKGIVFDEDKPQFTLVKQEEKKENIYDIKKEVSSNEIKDETVRKLTPKEKLERIREWLLSTEKKIETALGFDEEEQSPIKPEERARVLKFRNPNNKEDK